MTFYGEIRRAVLSSPTLSTLNSVIKGQLLEARHQQLVAHYGRIPNSGRKVGRERSLELRVEKINEARRARPLRILYLGTDEQQDRGGLLQALSALGELEIFRSATGAYGHVPASHEAFDSMREANGVRLLEVYDTLALKDRRPDLVMGQMWGATMANRALAYVKRRGSVTINICMDDRQAYLRGSPLGTHALIPEVDLFGTTAPEAVDWFEKEGARAFFLPEASDPEIFHPFEKPKRSQVAFVGARYGIRKALVEALQAAGISVAVYGTGWPAGRLDVSLVPELFATSKIVLGVGTIGHAQNLFSLKMRDFDGPMSGSLYITSHNPDLALVYEIGKELVTYRTIEECVQECRWYLSSEVLREEVASRGRTRALERHTWRRRFQDLFGALGLPMTDLAPAPLKP